MRNAAACSTDPARRLQILTSEDDRTTATDAGECLFTRLVGLFDMAAAPGRITLPVQIPLTRTAWSESQRVRERYQTPLRGLQGRNDPGNAIFTSQVHKSAQCGRLRMQ
jgi:hypothetical protein